MLADPAVDLVHICVPSGDHANLGVLAAAAGKHVLVEKPIDVTLEAADRLIEACDKAGVLLSCISQHASPTISSVKNAVDAGRFERSVWRLLYNGIALRNTTTAATGAAHGSWTAAARL